VPIVIVSRDLTERGVSSVLVDNEAAGAMAMRHLHELGHRRIAVIRGPEQLFRQRTALGWACSARQPIAESSSIRGWSFNCPT
jgi:DNA-binding LacI/PurR family transcriptional regulator